nr:hypothetical protein SHINE37_120335 [Rhizobiaceae bacterium]
MRNTRFAKNDSRPTEESAGLIR